MKNYTITVNGNVYDVTVEEGTGSSAPAKAATPKAAAPKAAPADAEPCVWQWLPPGRWPGWFRYTHAARHSASPRWCTGAGGWPAPGCRAARLP